MPKSKYTQEYVFDVNETYEGKNQRLLNILEEKESSYLAAKVEAYCTMAHYLISREYYAQNNIDGTILEEDEDKDYRVEVKLYNSDSLCLIVKKVSKFM